MKSDDSSLFDLLDQALGAHLGATRWYVGFSGGLDSTVLLHLVHRWSQMRTGVPKLVALHINHGLQDSADDWQTHCQNLCNNWGIPFQSEAVDVARSGDGIESAARDARYRVFEERLQAGELLLLGHHLDDQVETFFLRLMRGAGVQGLSGMPQSRDLGVGRLLRPLLSVTRDDLECYASAQGIGYIEDPSNTDTSLDRNFLRQQVLPLIEQRWQGYRQTVSRASQHLTGAASALESAVPQPATVCNAFGDPGVALSRLELESPDIASVQIRSWLRRQGLQAPGTAALDEFLRQLRGLGDDDSPRLSCEQYSVVRYRDALYLLPLNRCTPSGVGALAVDHPFCKEHWGELRLVTTASQGLFLRADEVLDVRWRTGGERCQPAGRGRGQSLKKLLQERQVPPWWRDQVPLLYCGQELLAVGDLWLCESSRLVLDEGDDRPRWTVDWQRNTFGPPD